MDDWIDSPPSQAVLSSQPEAYEPPEAAGDKAAPSNSRGVPLVDEAAAQTRTPSETPSMDHHSIGAGAKGIKRMTEAERLLTLWAGDRCGCLSSFCCAFGLEIALKVS